MRVGGDVVVEAEGVLATERAGMRRRVALAAAFAAAAVCPWRVVQQGREVGCRAAPLCPERGYAPLLEDGR